MPGITNPAEEYFKDGIWGWATATWEKLISSGGRLFTALHGWDGTAWHKLPMVWGFSEDYAERVSNLNAAAGVNALVGSTVPAGEVWVVEALGALATTTVPTRIVFQVYDGTRLVPMARDDAPVLSIYSPWAGRVTLAAGSKVNTTFYGCVAGDDIYLDIWGYKMKIAE